MTLLKFFSLMVFASLSANASPMLWTKASFEKSCLSNNGRLKKSVDQSRTHLECQRNGVETASAWFDKNNRLMGSLERSRATDKTLILDQEFDAKGLLKEKTYVIHSEPSEGQHRNLFVFDASGSLKRGNITMGRDTYVIAAPNLVFKNGQPIQVTDLAAQLQKTFGVPSSKSFSDQIQKIWEKQNLSSSPAATPKQPEAAK